MVFSYMIAAEKERRKSYLFPQRLCAEDSDHDYDIGSDCKSHHDHQEDKGSVCGVEVLGPVLPALYVL